MLCHAGSNLQALVQQLLEQLQAASSPHKPQTPATTRLRGAAGGSGRYSLGPTPAAGEWQCDSAAAVVVLTEVLFGASDAWQPHLAATAAPKAAAASSTAGNTAATAAGRQAGQQGHQQELGMDAGYESVLLQALAAFVRPKLWGLPTAQSLGGGPAETGKRDRIPAQVRRALSTLSRDASLPHGFLTHITQQVHHVSHSSRSTIKHLRSGLLMSAFNGPIWPCEQLTTKGLRAPPPRPLPHQNPVTHPAQATDEAESDITSSIHDPPYLLVVVARLGVC